MIMTSPHEWDPHNVAFPSCSTKAQDEVNPHDKLMAVETLLQHTIYNPLTIASLILTHVHILEVNNGVRTGLPVGVGIGSLPVTPDANGEISVLCVESDLAGVGRHNKT